MGSSLREALLPSRAFRRQPPGVMGIWQLRSHGAGVDRVGQHVVEGVVDGQLPGDASALAPIPDCRQRQALVAHPEGHLPNRLQLGKLGEDERDRLLHAAVRILLDAVVVHLEVAYGDGEKELAAAGLLLQGFERALAEEGQLHLAHGALHAEQKPVVRMARIVDAILIKDQRADQAAELEQRVPVAAVAGEARGFDRDDGADAALADGGEQLLEARPGNTGAGAAEIVVDHLNGVPPQRTGAIDEGILPAAALVIVEDLIGRRLANIDEGATGQVLRRDLGHRRPPERPRVLSRPAGRRRPPPSEGSEEAGSAWPADRAAGVEPSPFPRTDPFDCVVRSASLAPLRRAGSRPDEARSASTRARTSAKLSIESRGGETSWWEAAAGAVIQTGRSVRVRSGWRMTR